QDFVEIPARAHRVDEDQLDLLVRSNDENIPHCCVVVRRPAFRGVTSIGRQHAVKLRYGEVGVRDHWVVWRGSCRLFDIDGPLLVAVDGVDAQTDYFDIPAIEFRFELRHGAELGGANWCEILWM